MSGPRPNEAPLPLEDRRSPTSRGCVAGWVAIIAVVAGQGCGGGPAEPPGLLDGVSRTVLLESPAFIEGGAIPKAHTCDGKDVSPPLKWDARQVPAGTRALALVCDDPDAPRGTWAHWLLFNVSPGVHELPEALATTAEVPLPGSPSPAVQGRNDFGRTGYGGPCPPGGTHHYVFRLFALDTPLPAGSGSGLGVLLRAMRGHVLAHGRLVGTYAR